MLRLRDSCSRTSSEVRPLKLPGSCVKGDKVVAEHGEMLAWPKSIETGLGHVHANMVVLYFRLRADDSQLTAGMKKWANETGYRELPSQNNWTPFRTTNCEVPHPHDELARILPFQPFRGEMGLFHKSAEKVQNARIPFG
jgi:hypothetical protein